MRNLKTLERSKHLIIVLSLFLSGCAASNCLTAPERTGRATMKKDHFLVSDGTRLPMRSWAPEEGAPEGVLIAVHGYNDYSNFIKQAAKNWCESRLLTYAYDQRGFGDTPTRGKWTHHSAMVEDLKEIIHLIHDRHPELPVYVLGESMGGAVAMVAVTDPDAPQIDGVILSAPAVWGRDTMAWYERFGLWFMAATNPDMPLVQAGTPRSTSEGPGDIVASDNKAVLQEMLKDPKVLKETNVGILSGVVDLMDMALARATQLQVPSLILYGKKDQIIKRGPFKALVERLPEEAEHQILVYEDGYHLLLRDLQANKVMGDVLDWINGRTLRTRVARSAHEVVSMLSH